MNIDLTLRVFDIEYFATKDGPGIRTVIFTKGCPLECQWCQNPESQKHESEILYHENLCSHCFKCVKECENNSILILNRIIKINKYTCTACGKCTSVCVNKALKKVGENLSIEEIKEAIKKDIDFYKASSGGVTFSGGEPVLWIHKIIPITQWCKENGIHCAIETSGYCNDVQIQKVIDNFDLIYIDLKHVNNKKHISYTNSSNNIILNNIKLLIKKCSDRIIIRIPVIPNFNHSQNDAEEILTFLKKNKCKSKIEVLPYHDLGKQKYDALFKEYALGDIESLKKEDLIYWQEMAEKKNLTLTIGSN